MLVGVLLGIVISILLFGVFYLTGVNRTLGGQISVLSAQAGTLKGEVMELTQKAEGLQSLLNLVQQPYSIHLSDDQTVRVAQMIIAKVQLIMESEHAKELRKLD